MQCTLVFVTLRYAEHHDAAFVRQLKQRHGLRIVAIVDQASAAHVPAPLQGVIDEIQVLPSTLSCGMQQVFAADALVAAVQAERERFPQRALRLVSCCEFNLMAVGEARRRLGLPGPDDRALLLFRDKLAMKQRVAAAGLQTPRHRPLARRDLLGRGMRYEALAEALGPRFVVKPVAAAGSVGVHMVRDAGDFARLAASPPAFEALEAEQFIDGVLYHVDSVVQHGRTVLHTVSEYLWPNFEFTRGRLLGSMNLPPDDPLAARLTGFAERVLQALGTLDVSTHMEIFMRDGEPVFLEVGARPPGAAVCRAHRLGRGVNYMDLDLQLQAGIAIDAVPAPAGHALWAYLPRRDGTVLHCAAPALESAHDIEWKVRPGDRLRAAQHVGDCAAVIVAHGREHGPVRRDFERLRSFEGLTMADARQPALAEPAG